MTSGDFQKLLAKTELRPSTCQDHPHDLACLIWGARGAIKEKRPNVRRGHEASWTTVCSDNRMFCFPCAIRQQLHSRRACCAPPDRPSVARSRSDRLCRLVCGSPPSSSKKHTARRSPDPSDAGSLADLHAAGDLWGSLASSCLEVIGPDDIPDGDGMKSSASSCGLSPVADQLLKKHGQSCQEVVRHLAASNKGIATR